ncbi:hypothetical protein BCR37DRAFT_54377 [Protomyces lactucae-debilis]|uniref:Uncharacterized protein n=1 Tax=Protomyces lactucae-debilis TaxID=2754530 RepID=A0A1Y2FAA0_PROLT|nr:uncharacterized protein BCR37DRAFT_54377 [Protomyces lactucae-debilis]ORY80839.1 hypothetical protein BCR37DRAFT_54377 [Protomyces lactucae-debilis]
MRVCCTTSYVWLLMTSLCMVLLLYNVTASAGRTAAGESSKSKAASKIKRPRTGSSINSPASKKTRNPLPGEAKRLKSAFHQENVPECRNVSVNYHVLFDPRNDPDTTRARPINAPHTSSSESDSSCKTDCQQKIDRFERRLIEAIRMKNRPPACWASKRFSIVQRRATLVGDDISTMQREVSLTGCDSPNCHMLSTLCQCSFNLMIPEQMNATRAEIQSERLRLSRGGVYTQISWCDLRQFPATMSNDLGNTGQVFQEKMAEQQKMEVGKIEKQSWPLLGWQSVPKEAVILGVPFSCPEPLAKGAERKLSSKVEEICICPNNHDNDKRQCSHKELICETVSLAQAVDNLRRGGGGLFDVYVEKFPQLKDYVEPISGTAIATDQVSQENWATLLAAVDSVIERGLDSDLNLPAEANDEF